MPFNRAGDCEPLAVGAVMPDLPVFLDEDYCIDVPLETTCAEAFCGLPGQVKAVLEAA
jgi:hypothetical protein